MKEPADISGNPFCCAAALANIEFLSSAGQLAKMRVSSKAFEAEISATSVLPGVKQVNVRGLMAAFIFDTVGRVNAVVAECIRCGVLPVCTGKNSIKLAPPLVIHPVAIREAASVIRAAILKCASVKFS